jgi:hypothetical protein
MKPLLNNRGFFISVFRRHSFLQNHFLQECSIFEQQNSTTYNPPLLNFSMRSTIVVMALLCHFTFSYGQPQPAPEKTSQGRLYIYWGWNRGWFSNSDIRFKGSNYNFLLKDVVAKDRQSPFDADLYLNPARMSIPQTNFRIGYFLTDHWNISMGVDHMKYVMQQNQNVGITGYIQDTETPYNNIYNNNKIILTSDFLTFEHTNGLNYVNVESRRSDQWFSSRRTGIANISISTTAGAGAGILYPRTDTKLLGYKRYDEFHVAGYGLAAILGINVTFWNIFFLQTEVKGGFINMPDIRTTELRTDKGSQHFFFLQHNYELGMSIRLRK